MGVPTVLSLILAAADDDGIAASQTPLAAGNLTLDGVFATAGVATLDVARRVLITSAGNDSALTFTVYGTNGSNSAISEAVAGPNATTAATVQDFKTVTRVAVSAATAGAVKVGTNGVGATRWLPLNIHADNFHVSIGVKVTGTVNFTVQYTYDDPNVTIPPTAWDLTALAAKTANTDSSLTSPVVAVRLAVNSGDGTAAATVIPSGLAG